MWWYISTKPEFFIDCLNSGKMNQDDFVEFYSVSVEFELSVFYELIRQLV